MATRNVVLINHEASFGERLINTELYQNASEVLGEGLLMVKQREVGAASRLEAVRNAVKVDMLISSRDAALPLNRGSTRRSLGVGGIQSHRRGMRQVWTVGLGQQAEQDYVGIV